MIYTIIQHFPHLLVIQSKRVMESPEIFAKDTVELDSTLLNHVNKKQLKGS